MGCWTPRPDPRLSGKKETGLNMGLLSTAGLGGVWAEENTRESIFAAMQRKETFGTSGVRIKVRLFGGWDFHPDVLNQKDWVKTGYETAYRWAATFPKKAGKAPTFIVWAVKDPDDGNLDRIQIIKGWTKSGQIFEKVYDVAWSGGRKPDPVTGKVPPVGNTVDVKNATYTNSIGAVELKTVWRDPSSIRACMRSTTPGSCRFRPHDGPPTMPRSWACRHRTVAPATVQERAWTSPIWYSPTEGEARKSEEGHDDRRTHRTKVRWLWMTRS